MVYHAFERITHYIEESGINIHIDIINEKDDISSIEAACTEQISCMSSPEERPV